MCTGGLAGRYSPEKFRAENVASLEMIDYVCIVDDEAPV